MINLKTNTISHCWLLDLPVDNPTRDTIEVEGGTENQSSPSSINFQKGREKDRKHDETEATSGQAESHSKAAPPFKTVRDHKCGGYHHHT